MADTDPGDWPEGHFWVSVGAGHKATCKDCREAFKLACEIAEKAQR